MDFVLGADTGEYPIDQTDRRQVSWHKAADLRHQSDDRHLTNIGGFARHIWTGDDMDPRRQIEMAVIGHVARRTLQELLDDRMSARLDIQYAVLG